MTKNSILLPGHPAPNYSEYSVVRLVVPNLPVLRGLQYTIVIYQIAVISGLFSENILIRLATLMAERKASWIDVRRFILFALAQPVLGITSYAVLIIDGSASFLSL